MMRFKLRHRSAAAIAPGMGARVIRMLLVMAMLLGSMMSPAILHAAGPDAAHLLESAHVELDFDHIALDADEDRDQFSPDGQEKTLPHHHCASSLALISPYLMPTVLAGRVHLFGPRLSAAMASWKAAPPTQPPSA